MSIGLAVASIHDDRPGLRPPAFARLLGDTSYTLYPAHYAVRIAVFLVYSKLLPRHPSAWLMHAAALVATLVSVQLYRWIEKPLIRASRKWIEHVLGLKRPDAPAPLIAGPNTAGAVDPGPTERIRPS